jgi:TRAP-type C4-dicarboxylate transport system permease small subunit
MLQEMRRINRAVSMWLERVGIVALLFMMGVTCVDVIGIKVFRSPLHGAIDMAQLAQVVGIAFAIASTQVLGKQVMVDFFMNKASARAQAIVDTVVYFILFILFVCVVWRLFALGYSFQTAGEVTPTLYAPFHPVVYGAALACVPVSCVFLIEFLSSLMKVVKR